MSTTCPDCARRQTGFAIVSAIFILVVLAALAGFIVSTTTTQNLSFAQDIQGTRAYQAARAGTEIGIARWLADAPSDVTVCDGIAVNVALAGTPLADFSVTMTPTLSSSGGVNFCTIVAQAVPTGVPAGSAAYVEREIRVVVEGNPAP